MGIRAATVDGRKNHRRTENAHRGRTHRHTDTQTDRGTEGRTAANSEPGKPDAVQGTRQTPTDARTAAAVNGAQEKPENAHRRTEGSGNRAYITVLPRPVGRLPNGGKTSIYIRPARRKRPHKTRKHIYIYTPPPPPPLNLAPARSRRGVSYVGHKQNTKNQNNAKK